MTRLEEILETIAGLRHEVQVIRNARAEDEDLRDEVIIMKGQMNKADNTVEKLFEEFTGNVIAELDFIDKTTFGYLDSIPKNCGICIITSNIKNEEKCKTRSEKCARERPYLEIVKINKVHERWIGSTDSYFIQLGTDLKSDALGHCMHTIRSLHPRNFTNAVDHFNQLWKKTHKQLRLQYGETVEKSLFFSYVQQESG